MKTLDSSFREHSCVGLNFGNFVSNCADQNITKGIKLGRKGPTKATVASDSSAINRRFARKVCTETNEESAIAS
jgi:hypothetical protein